LIHSTLKIMKMTNDIRSKFQFVLYSSLFMYYYHKFHLAIDFIKELNVTQLRHYFTDPGAP